MQITDGNRAPNLLPVTLLLSVVLWLFTMTGGRDIFVKEVLGGAYDSQAEHFLRGDVDVDVQAVQPHAHYRLRDAHGRRPVFNGYEKMQTDPHFKDYIWFHEYFDGDDGRGLGASHQTGWTGLIAVLLDLFGRVTAEDALEILVTYGEVAEAERLHRIVEDLLVLARAELGELVGWIASREHVEYAVERRGTEIGKRRGASHQAIEVVDRHLLHRHGRDDPRELI